LFCTSDMVAREMCSLFAPCGQAGAVPNSQSPVEAVTGGDGATSAPLLAPPMYRFAHWHQLRHFAKREVSVSQLWREDKVRGLTFSLVDPHMQFMTSWQKSFKRELPKTKTELRDMLAEAVRNTQPEPKRPPPKIKRVRARSG
jgi:hypothetical protein